MFGGEAGFAGIVGAVDGDEAGNPACPLKPCEGWETEGEGVGLAGEGGVGI